MRDKNVAYNGEPLTHTKVRGRYRGKSNAIADQTTK